MDHRSRARELAAGYLGKGDPKGWFEQLYREAEDGKSSIPWADRYPNPNLVEFWNGNAIAAHAKTALAVGCGLGDDAEQLAAWGLRRLPSISRSRPFEPAGGGFPTQM